MSYLLTFIENHLSIIILAFALVTIACSEEEDDLKSVDPDPDEALYYLPVVVHVLHQGEPVGEGPNLSTERIQRQIEILNEDFRRKEGTRGFNNHPDGGDTKIEFVLAKQDPNGQPTSGIVRTNISLFDVPVLGYSQNNYAQYSYWNSTQYINIWTTPLDESISCLVLGLSTGPETDLPGTHLLAIPEPNDAEGIIIPWMHFGESTIDCHARFGRTLTHEMGHYLGLLHPWAGLDCEFNDYCDDTPAVDDFVWGRTPFVGCAGDMIMIGNYMNYSDDEIMNIFTNDQISRMHYVLDHHAGRHALVSSPGLK